MGKTSVDEVKKVLTSLGVVLEDFQKDIYMLSFKTKSQSMRKNNSPRLAFLN
ncbi:hypothetical protein ABEX78_20145 [Priestia megaterium]